MAGFCFAHSSEFNKLSLSIPCLRCFCYIQFILFMRVGRSPGLPVDKVTSGDKIMLLGLEIP